MSILIQKQKKKVLGLTKPENETGQIVIDITDRSSLYEQEFSRSFHNVSQLIDLYRSISVHPAVDFAITEIVNSAFVADDSGLYVRPEVESNRIDVDYVDLWKSGLKKHKVQKNLKKWFRKFYIDGRLFLEKIYDENDKFVEYRYIDPRKIIKVVLYEKEKPENFDKVVYRESNGSGEELYVVDEFYIYYEHSHGNVGDAGDVRFVSYSDWRSSDSFRKIPIDKITYIDSGIVSEGVVWGFLHKTLKEVNKLQQTEDPSVINRVTRAVQRFVFNVDVGMASPEDAKNYINQIARQYRNKISYDPVTGKISGFERGIGIVEDFWLAKFSGGRGTEITTIGGDSNFQGVVDELRYHKENLMMSLNVPLSRFQQDTAAVVLGASEEVTREELRFSDYIDDLRNIFVSVCEDLFIEILVNEEIITRNEADDFLVGVSWVWSEDSYYAEMKEISIRAKRIENAVAAKESGFFSDEYIRKEILKIEEDDVGENLNLDDEGQTPGEEIPADEENLEPPEQTNDEEDIGPPEQNI